MSIFKAPNLAFLPLFFLNKSKILCAMMILSIMSIIHEWFKPIDHNFGNYFVYDIVETDMPKLRYIFKTINLRNESKVRLIEIFECSSRCQYERSSSSPYTLFSCGFSFQAFIVKKFIVCRVFYFLYSST